MVQTLTQPQLTADNRGGGGERRNHGAQLQAAALQTREQLGQLETQLKQASAHRPPYALCRILGGG